MTEREARLLSAARAVVADCVAKLAARDPFPFNIEMLRAALVEYKDTL